MDIIDAITDIDEQLVQWIIHASPDEVDQENQMKSVVALRGDLDQAINVIVLKRLTVSTLDLTTELKQLNDITGSITAAAKEIDTVKTVISLAASAVSVATKIVSLVT